MEIHEGVAEIPIFPEPVEFRSSLQGEIFENSSFFGTDITELQKNSTLHTTNQIYMFRKIHNTNYSTIPPTAKACGLPCRAQVNILKVVIGGTFGYLHRGHKALLTKAFEIGDYIYIGLTTDKYVQTMKNAKEIPSYTERETLLRKFVGKFGKKFEIAPLDDKFGPATTADFDAIVVTKETLPTAMEINHIRENSELPALSIVVIEFILAFDSMPISTTRIINGEIDRNGTLVRRRKGSK